MATKKNVCEKLQAPPAKYLVDIDSQQNNKVIFVIRFRSFLQWCCIIIWFKTKKQQPRMYRGHMFMLIHYNQLRIWHGMEAAQVRYNLDQFTLQWNSLFSQMNICAASFVRSVTVTLSISLCSLCPLSTAIVECLRNKTNITACMEFKWKSNSHGLFQQILISTTKFNSKHLIISNSIRMNRSKLFFANLSSNLLHMCS